MKCDALSLSVGEMSGEKLNSRVFYTCSDILSWSSYMKGGDREGQPGRDPTFPVIGTYVF